MLSCTAFFLSLVAGSFSSLLPAFSVSSPTPVNISTLRSLILTLSLQVVFSDMKQNPTQMWYAVILGSSLIMQNAMNQNLHFNKFPRWFIATWKFAKRCAVRRKCR
jgi:hypothetical protein